MKTESNILSSDGKTSLHVIEWIPEGEVRGTLQIVHGMVEFIDRYDRFASFLSDSGYAVVGHDQLGHGASVSRDEDFGYIGKHHPDELFIQDIHLVRQYIDDRFKGCRHYILGHSMGSFLVGEYITRYGEGLSGAVISGTGYQNPAVLDLGLFLTRFIAMFRTDRYRSRFINNMAMGSYNRSFEPARTRNDWLTRDERIVDLYCENPWDNYIFTLNGYKALFRSIKASQNRKRIENIPKDLKILIVSGENDPVGNFGEGPRKVWESYQNAGINDVFLRIYEGDRHEILNELDYETVYNDIMEWMSEE